MQIKLTNKNKNNKFTPHLQWSNKEKKWVAFIRFHPLLIIDRKLKKNHEFALGETKEEAYQNLRKKVFGN